MAESGGSAERSSKKPCYKGRVAGKLPASPIQRLLYREIGGLHRHHQSLVNTQIFHKLPGRLGFSLRNLVDETVLIEGHIFLGFSKNGQFVISYTFHLEADEHTAYPIYVYRLHWWHFVPYKRLKKVGEVRLFGEEDIQQELYIAVCEWPTISSRVLIYGYCAPIDNEKHQCYITITSVPPVGPCEDCSQIAILHSRTGVTNSLSESPPRCLNHAFTLHTKYELAPPYPSFAPKIFLKLDGVMVVNTGDSLIALSVDIEDNHSTFGFGLYSPRLARSVSNLSTTSSPYDDQMSSDSQDILSEPRPLEELDNAEPMLGIFGQSPCSNVVIRGGLITRDPHQSHSETRMHVKEKHVSTGKENLLSSPKHSMDAFSPKHTMDAFSPKHPMDAFSPKYSIDTFSPKSNVDTFSPKHSIEATYRHEASSSKAYKSPYDVYNFDAGTPKKDESETGDSCEWGETASCSQVKVRASLSFTGMQPSASMGNEETEIQLQQPDALDSHLDSQTLDDDVCKPNRMDVFQKPADVLRTVGPREPLVPTNNTFGRVLPGLTLIPPENFGLSKTVAISPGCGAKLDGGSSTCSSCVSSPIILQSDSQCFTYSVRRYVEYYSGRDSPVEVEDDLNFAYHSVLPLEVHGANYSSMRLLTKHLTVPPMPCVVAKQLTLDIEHYLGETVKTTAEWGHRYLAFTDYDVQILEVCPGTCEVIAMVFVLIRARPPKDKHIHGRTMSRLYQTGFKLIWNLSTGSYSTLDVEDLTEVQHDALRKRWQPGHRICDTIQRRFAVPQTYCRSVHVLTNESVFKGQSLKMLLDRHHYVAILL